MSMETLTGLSAAELRELAELASRKEELMRELIQVNEKMGRIMKGDAPVRVPRDKNRGEKIVDAIRDAGGGWHHSSRLGRESRREPAYGFGVAQGTRARASRVGSPARRPARALVLEVRAGAGRGVIASQVIGTP